MVVAFFCLGTRTENQFESRAKQREKTGIVCAKTASTRLCLVSTVSCGLMQQK